MHCILACCCVLIFFVLFCYRQWLNYYKVDGGTLNSGVDVVLSQTERAATPTIWR